MNRETKMVNNYGEVVKLFPLFHKFFAKTKVDYTEQQFFTKLPWILQNGAIGYVTEDGEPVAYGVIIETQLFDTVGLILQVYSERPFLLGRLQELADFWCNMRGIRKQVALVSPEISDTIKKRYDMGKVFVYMVRQMKEEPLEEIVPQGEVVV